MKNPLSFHLWLCILLSVACLQTLYSQRPRGISQDATFSLFAAQNAVEHGRFQSIDHVIDSDLGKIKLQWLTLWHPLVSLGYAALLKAGLSPGAASNLMVLVLVFSGTLGWVLLFQRAGVNRVALHVLACDSLGEFPRVGLGNFPERSCGVVAGALGFFSFAGLAGHECRDRA